jgi:hypothetical protein
MTFPKYDGKVIIQMFQTTNQRRTKIYSLRRRKKVRERRREEEG